MQSAVRSHLGGQRGRCLFCLRYESLTRMDRSREDRVTSHQSPVTRHGEWLLDDVRRPIERSGLLRPANTVVVAVSGGADSVALLHLLADLRHEYALVLRVAHLNHRLRPDADTDAEFVRQTATNLGIPITVEEVDVSARAAAQKRSLEDAGRQARYEFFARVVAGTMGAGCIATAHTQDDQVETVAMRLLQGAAWETLAGIPTSRRL